MSLPVLPEEGSRPVRPDDDIHDILGASTGEFEVMSDELDGSMTADHELDEMLGESTGQFRMDQIDETAEPDETPKKYLLKAHLAYLDRQTSSAALDDVRNRIRALTAEKQKLYQALRR